jgi:hypothetical protein
MEFFVALGSLGLMVIIGLFWEAIRNFFLKKNSKPGSRHHSKRSKDFQ